MSLSARKNFRTTSDVARQVRKILPREIYRLKADEASAGESCEFMSRML